MKIIISPAKKMNVDRDSMPWTDLPEFLDQTEYLKSILQSMSDAQLKKLWKCNDQIARLNLERLRDMDLRSCLTPAILAYEGIQYRYMAPGVFSDSEFAYIRDHLRILSGFYGILRPFDGVTPYRLEMQAKLQAGEYRDLYEFWGNSLAESLFRDTDCVINLASKEYSVCISKNLAKHIRFITCVFGQEIEGKIVEKGTLCKMARGEMVRFLAEHQITDPEQLRQFDRLGFRYHAELSDVNKFVFIQHATKS